ncbi:MAG: cupin domain-containing protein [Nitrosopumilus sp.]|nr:cupin domain-containing protein [Nitrosopumilus sp.]
MLEGSGNLKIDNHTYHIEKDDSAYVPPNAIQCITNSNSKNLRFLCIVEPAWEADSEILLE